MAKASDDAEKEVFGTLRYITSYEWLDSIWHPISSGRRYVIAKRKKSTITCSKYLDKQIRYEFARDFRLQLFKFILYLLKLPMAAR